MPDAPRIAILLATFEGEAFIDEQIESLSAQQGLGRIDVIVSDDGSKDGTPERLTAWTKQWTRGSFEVVEGPRRGFAENFRSLIITTSIDADFVAYCDQDDVWDADKLAAAIRVLAPAGNEPGLYLSRTRLIDAKGRPAGYSPLFSRPPDFRNALVQSIGGGNTIVLNRAGFALVQESARRTGFVSHDWWSYIIVSGAGGRVIYDPIPHIGYRQHGGNLVGRNTGLWASAQRLGYVLKGRFARWTDQNLEGLRLCRDLLTPEAAALCDRLADLRRMRGPKALHTLDQLRLWRQTARGDIGLKLATFIGKL